MDAMVQPFKKGMIILWSGSIETIPGGWALCDGNNGTPNLHERFVWGAGGNTHPNETGGSFGHNHAVPLVNHTHTLVSGHDIAAGSNYDKDTDVNNPTVTGEEAYTIPPYYVLAYIMKL